MIKSLYKQYQFWAEKGGVYIISDPHFDDEDSILMNPNWMKSDEYVNKLNNIIHKNDTLICLGDCGDLHYISQLKAGHKVLIKGNHDDKGDFYYERKEFFLEYDKSSYNRKDLLENLEKEYPNHKIKIIDGINISLDNKDKWIAYLDNNLFDEVYDGPIFISDQILLSHEPINGLKFCCNIHGHCHNYYYDYTDNLGGRHLNLAADVVNWQVVELNKLIKSGLISKLPTIHRIVIDKAIENPIHKKE